MYQAKRKHFLYQGKQEGHIGAPCERLPFSLRCLSPRSRKKSEATSTESDFLAQGARKDHNGGDAFVDGVTQPLQRVLKPLKIRVVGKQATLKWCQQHLLKSSSNRDEDPDVVYRSSCNDCDQSSNIAETGHTTSTHSGTCFVCLERTLQHVGCRGPHDFHQHSLSFRNVQTSTTSPVIPGVEWKRRCTSGPDLALCWLIFQLSRSILREFSRNQNHHQSYSGFSIVTVLVCSAGV